MVGEQVSGKNGRYYVTFAASPSLLRTLLMVRPRRAEYRAGACAPGPSPNRPSMAGNVIDKPAAARASLGKSMLSTRPAALLLLRLYFQ